MRLKSLLDEYNRNGFSYVNYSHSDNYGISLSAPSYVISIVEKLSDMRLLLFTEKGWGKYQDVIACIKI